MGIFGVLGKIIQGKPVFEPQNSANQPPAGVPVEQQMQHTGTGPKQPPMITIDRVDCHENGAQMQVQASIKNESQGQVDLDKLTFMGSSQDLGTFLRAGEEREFTVYSGNRPQNTGYNRFELTFKDETGDYFMASFHVQWRALGDGTFVVDRLQLQGPIRDI